MTANLPPASGGPAARGAEDELYPATDGAVTPLAVDTPGVEAVGVAPGPTQATTEPGAEARGTSVWGAAFQRLRRNPAAIAGAVIVALFLLVAVLAPLLAPYGGTETPGMREIRPTSVPGPGEVAGYPLGLDRFGGDVLSKLLWGAQASLLIGVVSTCLLYTSPSPRD